MGAKIVHFIESTKLFDGKLFFERRFCCFSISYERAVFSSSRRDRYLGMTAAIPQVPVPTAMASAKVLSFMPDKRIIFLTFV